MSNNGNQRDFESGDWVAIVGGKLSRAAGIEVIEPSIRVGKVLYVGKWDMIIEGSSWTYSSTFPVKKERCTRIDVKPEFARTTSPESPQLGDMVLHYKDTKFDKSDPAPPIIGVLMETSQDPGYRAKGFMLHADELVEVELADLIVLQRKDDKK